VATDTEPDAANTGCDEKETYGRILRSTHEKVNTNGKED
jgi:hypothetical protein